MKWFLVIVVILNAVVGMYGILKQKPAVDINAQDINAAQLKILPAGWMPASAPVVASAAVASAPHAQASTPVTQPAALAPAGKLATDKPLPVVALPVPSPAPAKAVAIPAPAKPEVKPETKPETKPQAKAETPAVATQCLAWGGLNQKQLERVQGGLPQLKLPQPPLAAVKEETRGSGRTWVFYPPLATQAETQTLVAELRSKGFDSYIVKTDGEFRGHLSLGLFSTASAAQGLVARLKAAGYDKASIDDRSSPVKITTLSFRTLDAAQAERLRALQKRLLPGIPVKACS